MTLSKTIKTLLMLAWPVIIARSAQSVIGLSDALMSAPLGESGLAAVTTGAINVHSLVIFPVGVGFIVQSFSAQLKGQNNISAALKYAWYGLWIATLSGLISLALIPGLRPAMRLLGYAPQLQEPMYDYMSIRLFALFAIVAVEVLGNWFAGLGDTRPHMTASILAMFINVGLNWLLITGNAGMPALGEAGAAIASATASVCSLVWILRKFYSIRKTVSKRPPLEIGEFKNMMAFGLPNGINWFLEFAAFTVFLNVVVAHLGVTELAAMMIVVNLNSVAFMPAFGLGTAGAILTGQHIGSGQHDLVKQNLQVTGAIMAIWQLAIGMLYLSMPHTILNWFSKSDGANPELLRIGAHMLTISVVWQVFHAINMSIGETLRAAGDTLWPMRVRISVAWFLFMPGAWFCVVHLDGGYLAAMWSIVAYIFLLACTMVYRFQSEKWHEIQLLEPS